MSIPSPATPDPSPQPPLLELGDIWRCKWRIVACTVLFVAAGFGYLAVTPTTYEVSSRLAVSEDSPAIEKPSPGRWNREFLATQAEIIRSPLIVREALREVSVTVPETYPHGDTAFVLENLSVTPILQTDVLKISYRGHDPRQARELVAALVEKYHEHVRRDDRGRHTEELELLTRRETELREELEKLQEARTDFRRNSPLVGESRETLTVQANQIVQLAQRLSEARARRMELANKLRAYVVAKEELLRAGETEAVAASAPAGGEQPAEALPLRFAGTAAGDPSTNVLRDESNGSGIDFTEIQLQLWQAGIHAQNMAAKYSPRHPAMAGVEERVRYWENLLEERVQAAELGLSLELAAAEATETNLQAFLDEEQARVKQLDNFLVEEEAFVAKISRLEESHAGALTRLSEYRLTERALETGRSSVQVQSLDGPELLAEAIWPRQKLLLGLCGILGLSAGVVLVSLRKSRTPS